MRDNIYDYLISLGFKDTELEEINNNNEDIFFVFLDDVKENIDFLIEKGLNIKEIIKLVNNNPYMLTTTYKRRDSFDQIYVNELKLTKEEIKNLILNNNYCYTASPINLKKIIDHLISKDYSQEEIKTALINNSRIANTKFSDLEEML